MDDVNEGATEIWNRRYVEGGGTTTEVGNVGDPLDYNGHPFLWREANARRITGSADGHPDTNLGQKHFSPPRQKMLALGSGLASVEEWFVASGFVQHCVAFEASEVAVEKARARLAERGLADRIELRTDDVVHAGLPDQSFDVVLVQAAIHHFFNIEEMFQLMHRVLKPDGIFVYDEYVGPDHLLFDNHTLDIMDGIDACLDPHYRKSVLEQGNTRTGVPRPTLTQMLDMDPSEGVHASQILPLTYKYFDVIDRHDYGGTIMRPFFTGILQNFNFDDPRDQTIGRLIIYIEEVLLKHSIIQHSHTKIVARPRAVPRFNLTDADLARVAFEDWKGLPAD